MKQSVLFVCLGNICRSPTAEAVFRHCVQHNKATAAIDWDIDSCGTGGWHCGEAPDPRTRRAAAERGIAMDSLRARQFDSADFDRFDVILAMDQQNLHDLQQWPGASRYSGHLGLFLEYGTGPERQVPDPYYGGEQGFNHVLDLIEDASQGLLQRLLAKHR